MWGVNDPPLVINVLSSPLEKYWGDASPHLSRDVRPWVEHPRYDHQRPVY